MTRDPTWEWEFRKRVLECLVRDGTAVLARANEYMWEDEDLEIKAHALSCGIDLDASSWEDVTWTEFQGTLAEEPYWRRNGIEASITCLCTLLEGQAFRYTEGHAALLRCITDEG